MALDETGAEQLAAQLVGEGFSFESPNALTLSDSDGDEELPKVFPDAMSEAEQLDYALSLSLQDCSDVECVDLGNDVTDEIILDCEKEQKKGNEKHTYRLVSVVSHIGKGSRTGHYLCDVYDSTAKVWKSCDDSTVKDIEELEVRQKRSTTGYIFFYMHKKIFSAIDIEKF